MTSGDLGFVLAVNAKRRRDRQSEKWDFDCKDLVKCDIIGFKKRKPLGNFL